jgi:hypothetical protein
MDLDLARLYILPSIAFGIPTFTPSLLLQGDSEGTILSSPNSRSSNMVVAASLPRANVPTTRGYQQEMLEESIKRNIIIAMDTGSGKTHIAVLRMKHEVEREHSKVRNKIPYSFYSVTCCCFSRSRGFLHLLWPCVNNRKP